MRTMLPTLTLIALSIGLAGAPEAANAQAGPCDAPEYRQFDFWLGDWKVESANGNVAANRITREQGGCMVLETYTAGNFTGTSLNYYDRNTTTWNQTWVDNQGSSLRLTGGIIDGKMVLASDPSAGPVQRITWTPLDDGRVRQVWEAAQDDGSWNTAFDGYYSRK